MSDDKSVAKGIKPDAKREAKTQAKSQAKAAGKQLKELVKSLSPAQRDLLLRRLTEERSADSIPREGGPDAPLSFAQEREWFRDRLFPDVAHNIAGALRLEGMLSLPALRATLDAVVRRHEALRSSIHDAPDGPVQTVGAARGVPIEVVEARDWRDLHAREIERGFDLARDPLLRVTLVRL